jgi:hypothetical protein
MERDTSGVPLNERMALLVRTAEAVKEAWDASVLARDKLGQDISPYTETLTKMSVELHEIARTIDELLGMSPPHEPA